MSENTCNVCGANLIYKDGRWVCPACGAYKEEEISNEEVTLLYNASQKLRLASFDDAEELYADIVKKYPKNSEAHWGLVLSRYGIKYEDDYDGRKLPTCYAATMESFLSDKEYLAALSCAPDAKVKAYYEEQGKIIEKNRIEWYEKASKEPAYDVFLCFKDSDKENNIERTDDSIEVANLYTYLSGKGYRVFFSRETLRDKVAEKYEPYIYNALNTASVMIVYGSKPEYFESVWMKNEWTRFLKRMREGLKVDGSLIVAYDGMNPAELPKVFAGRQCLDARKKTFYGDLETLIARVIAIAKRPKAAVERIEIKGAVGRKKTSVGTQIKTIQAGGVIGKKAPIAVNTDVATREIGQYEVPELTPDEKTKTKNVFRFLSAGLFDDAQKVVEEILEKNHYNSRALFAKLLIHYEAKNETELAGKLSAVDDFEEIKAVIAYNDKSIGEKILSALVKQTMTFAENGDFDHAISYLREIGPYNSSAVTELKANLKPYTVSLLAEHPDTSEQLFAALLETYTDADSYIPYLQEYVNECLQNNCLELAKKYNAKVVELDDGDLNATLISMYLAVSANCLADFIEKADTFTEFAMLDSALRKFDADEVDGFFATMEKIISGLIGRQANGDAICRWFDFVTKYEFAGRQDLIRTTMASLAELSDCKKRSKLFDSILACIDSADVDRHISMRMEFAASLQSEGAFSLADKYYAQVLDIEEGNCDAMFGRILCGCGAESEWNLSEAVDKLEDFNAFEALLRYCPDEDTRCKYLNTVLSAINERSKSVTDKATIARLSDVFDGIVKYYPEDRNKELLSYTMQFAANAKNSSAFETAEKYYAVALSIDHLCHEAYWGLLQAKLSCRNNDDLIHQKTPISNMPEFSSAIAAAGDDDRSADRYVKLAKDQRDYLKEQRDKDIRHKKIKRRVTITATLLVFALLISGAIVAGVKYYQSESILKYDPNESGYSIVAGKFYKSATVELPHTVNEKALTVISAGAFKNNKTVETVIIPSSVTTIEAEAFSGCTNLKTIVFKSKTRSEIITLSVSPMSGSIKTESGVISIGDRAFYGCENLSAMDLSSIRSIGENAFDGCKALAELTLSDQLTTVKAGAFSGCASLKTVYLPATVEYLGRAAFSGCVGLESVVFEERDGGIGTFDIAWREGMSDHTKVDIGFKLTLDYGKSTGSIGAKTVAVIRDGNFTMPVPVRAGYTFVGWFTAVTDGEQLTDAEGKSLKKYNKDEAMILYAVFEANANKVSFDANGGTGSMLEQTIHTDEIAKLVANTFAKAGYTFVGWATAPDGKKVYNDTQSVEMGMESFTLYAVWEAKINTIRFDANGGSGEAFSQDIATDETRVLTKNTYTKNGYAFVGWATTPSGAIAYADQASYTMGTDASYTLYAAWKLADYSISYDLNGGVGDGNPTTYNMLSDSFTLYSPTRPGYTFLGWSGTGIEGIGMTVTVETGSFGERSYTANWKANSNRIIFNANGGTGTMPDQSVDTDDTVALNANTFTNEGYVFAGWSTTPSGTVLYADKAQYTMGTESAYTLYAVWKIKSYTISYQLNQGTVSGNPSKFFKTTPTFTLENPTRPGYTFLGWSGTGIAGMSKTVTIAQGSVGDRTYTANWEANTNSIIFHTNGGSGSMANQEMRTGESGKLSMNQFYATGCNFLGWATTQDGDVVYKDGATFTMGTASTYHLYAVWNVEKYSITYQLNKGEVSGNPANFTVLTPTFTLSNPTRPGYTFLGWSGTGIDGMSKTVTIEKGSVGNRTYTANWEANRNTIVFHPNGGTGTMENQTIPTDESQALTRNGFTKAGYAFAGWAISSDTAVKYQDGVSYTMGVEETYHLYAIWTPNQNTLTFDGNGATSGSMDALRKYSDEKFTLPGVGFTKTGYSFKGWSKAPNGTVLVQDGAGYTMDCQDQVILYAVWEQIKNIVSLDSQQGITDLGVVTLGGGENYILPVPVREGFTFVGWYSEKGGAGQRFTTADGKSISPWTTLENITLYAHWAGTASILYELNGNEYTVTGISDKSITAIFIPEYYMGRTVTQINSKAFADCKNVKMVFVPKTVTQIGIGAFEGCNALENLTIPFVGASRDATAENGVLGYIFGYDRVVGIEKGVSSGTSFMNNKFDINAIGHAAENPKGGIVQYGYWSLNRKNSNLYILDSVAYYYYVPSTLTTVTVTDDTRVSVASFYNCAMLNNIAYDGDLTSIGGFAFSYTEGLTLTYSGTTEGFEAIQKDTYWKSSANNMRVLCTDTVSVTFNGNGNDGGNMDKLYTVKGKSVDLPANAFTKIGYVFAGWSLSRNGEIVYRELDPFVGANPEYTLFAIWAPNENTLILDGNLSTSGSMNSVTIATGIKTKLPKNTYLKKGYVFVGWSSTPDGNVVYLDEAEYVMGSNSTYTLYAIWKANENTLHFDSNGGNGGSMSDMKIASDAKAALLKNGFTRSGYEFAGWAESASGSKVYSDEETYSMGLESAYTLYALWKPKTYSITYKLNGGQTSESNKTSYDIESDSFSLVNPVREGYIFVGWSGTGLDGNENLSASVSTGTYGDLTFTANWKAIEYKITYDLDGGVNAPENSGTYTVEDVITLVPPTKVGYRFDGWSNGGLIEKGSTGDKEFTATWSIIDYKISYELNGGINHAKNPESYTVNSADITLNEPTRPGYRFVGWSDEGTIPHGSTGDKTFVAQWEANSNTIKYDPNGGNGTMSDSIMHTDESAKLSQNTYARTGYVFAGWATEQGGVVQYKDESLYTMGAESEVILYAVWTPVTYRISYDLAGGNETSNPGEYNIETDDITLIIPTRPGYTFTGWSGTGIDGKQKLVTISKGSIGERQYTANWEANRNTIVFHPNGGTGTMENQTIPTDESQTLTRNGFSKVGYTFAGWAISSDTAVKYQDGASYTMGVEETYHLYAIWTPNQNTLTFDGNGATSGSMDALRKYSDEKFTLPGVGYTKTGYSFKGWSKTPNGTVLVQDGAGYTMDCQDQVIFYAVWEINQYTITIEANGGKGTTKITQDYNTVVKAPTLTRSGYAFEEWYADADFKTVYNFATMPADNITVYVKWQLSNFGGEKTGIRTPAELDAIRNNLAGNYYLENSIDMDGVDWLPIGNSTEPFTGSFDGKGNVIKNLSIIRANNKYVGLFGYSNSTITNVKITDAFYRPGYYTGGIVGFGSVSNSTWSGKINSGNLSSSSRYETHYTGGIVGWGEATGCSAYGEIEVILTTNQKTDIPLVGGIVGYVKSGGTISRCHANILLIVDQKLSQNGYGEYYASGITPGSENISIVNCYANGDLRVIKSHSSQWLSGYGYAITSTSSLPLSSMGKATIRYSYSGNVFYGEEKTTLTSSEYQSRIFMVNMGWDEDIWCFGYGKPVFYGDGYIRVVYSNVEGANNDSNPSGFKVGSDGFTLKIPYRAGYTFEGWYTDAAFTNKITEVKGLTTPLTVYAKWTANTYTITLNPVGGKLTDTTASVRYDSDYRLPVPTAGALGYVFAGWYDGTGAAAVALTDDTGKSLGTWTYTGDMTLYAKWDVQEEMKNFQFESTSTTCIITGVIDKTVTELIVPNFVTSIANGAFSGCGKLEKLTIPFTGESRKTVNPDYDGKNCLGYVFGSTFYEGGMEVKQATAVKTDLRFYIPESLHYVKVTEVAKAYAFYNCSSITSLSLENITNQIQANLCNGCANLSSCTLPIGLKYIGYGAFSGCNNLKDFNLSDCLDTIIEISYDAFEGCTSLFEIEGNVVYVTQWAIGTVSKDITQINIRKGTIGIAAHAFLNCTKLLLVQMPETLKFVGSSSFTGCSALETLILPDSVRNIGSSAFSKCLSLRSITIPSKIEKAGQYFVEGCEVLIFAEKDGIKYLGNDENPYIVAVYADKTLKNVILPSTVRVIADSAFKDCIDLVSVSLPAGLVTIEQYAFWGCTALSKINIPTSVQNIGLAFELDKCLNSLYEVEDGIAYIGNWAIGIVDNTQTTYTIRENTRGIAEYCFDESKCMTITIPNTLCFIGDDAFLRCKALEKIIYLGSKEQWQRCIIGHYGADQLTVVIVEFIVE